MATQTKSSKSATDAFEKVIDDFRKTAGAALDMQQDFYRQWTNNWAGLPQPQAAWADQVRELQKNWASTVTELARRHRETLDKQYRSGIKSMEEAFRVGQSKDPAEMGKRAEEFCRNALDCMRQTAESQIEEFQDAFGRWLDMLTKVGK